MPTQSGLSTSFTSSLLLSLALAVSLTGCVGSRVEYFTEDSYPPRQHAKPVTWLTELPTHPYLELARITVSSANAGEASLRRSLMDRARRLGADAVIPEPLILVESPAPTPYYEPGILGPMGAAFNLYGYGWYTPYTSNPYILVQGAVDQPRKDRYVSGIAIRYMGSSDSES